MYVCMYVCMSRTSSVKGREHAGLGFAPTMLCILPIVIIIHTQAPPIALLENFKKAPEINQWRNQDFLIRKSGQDYSNIRE